MSICSEQIFVVMYAKSVIFHFTDEDLSFKKDE